MEHSPIISESQGTLGHLLLIRDITKDIKLQREAERQIEQEEQLKQLHIQRRLVRDIHDGLGGLMTNIALTSALAQKQHHVAEKSHYLETLDALSAQANAELRDLMNTLELDAMPWSDLIESMRRAGNALFQNSGTTLRIDTGGLINKNPLGIVEGMSISRIIREGLNNISKHAKASEAALTISNDDDQLKITLVDDGCGFDVTTVNCGRGSGNMRNRAKELGGRFSIASSPKGTSLSVEIPMPISTR